MIKFKCQRCTPSHEWYPRTPNKPKVCPRCKSPYYDSARVIKAKPQGGKDGV
jgi:hypothetical protein